MRGIRKVVGMRMTGLGHPVSSLPHGWKTDDESCPVLRSQWARGGASAQHEALSTDQRGPENGFALIGR